MLLLAAPATIALFFLDIYAHRDQRIDILLQRRGWIYLVLAGATILLHCAKTGLVEILGQAFLSGTVQRARRTAIRARERKKCREFSRCRAHPYETDRRSITPKFLRHLATPPIRSSLRTCECFSR